MSDLNQSKYKTSRSSLDLPNFTSGSSKFSQIAAPLTSMLKTSSIKSAKPRKSVVGVGGGGRNKVEPVGKHKVDRVDRVDDSAITSMLKTSTSTNASASAAKIVVEFNGFDASGGAGGKSVKKLSKSRKSSKSPESLKGLKNL